MHFFSNVCILSHRLASGISNKKSAMNAIVAGRSVPWFLDGIGGNFCWEIIPQQKIGMYCNVGPPFDSYCKLVPITPITMVYGTCNYSYAGL